MVNGEATSHGGDYDAIDKVYSVLASHELDDTVPLKSLVVPKVLLPDRSSRPCSVRSTASVFLDTDRIRRPWFHTCGDRFLDVLFRRCGRSTHPDIRTLAR